MIITLILHSQRLKSSATSSASSSSSMSKVNVLILQVHPVHSASTASNFFKSSVISRRCYTRWRGFFNFHSLRHRTRGLFSLNSLEQLRSIHSTSRTRSILGLLRFSDPLPSAQEQFTRLRANVGKLACRCNLEVTVCPVDFELENVLSPCARARNQLATFRPGAR
jgi:hypothetical protein